MSPSDILATLSRVHSEIPRAALAAAEGQRAELTPALLASLAGLAAHPAKLRADPVDELPFYAMYLLAAWREPAAHPPIVAFLSTSDEDIVNLSGDVVTEDMNRILAQTCGGDASAISRLAGNRHANEWVRNAAIGALALLVRWGEAPRGAVIARYRELVAAAPAPVEDDTDVNLDNIAYEALNLQAVELRDDLLALYDAGRMDEMYVSREEIADELGSREPEPAVPPITDVAEAIAWWGCFRPDDGDELTDDASDAPVDIGPWDPVESRLAPAQPYRAPPKIGRNDPCPCGSGKKFKKCCGG